MVSVVSVVILPLEEGLVSLLAFGNWIPESVFFVMVSGRGLERLHCQDSITHGRMFVLTPYACGLISIRSPS